MQSPPDDTRGIVSPAEMFRHVELQRCAPPPELAGLIDWFWSVHWEFRMGFTHRQDVVAQPGVNVSVGVAPGPGPDVERGPYPLRCTVTGVSTGMSTRMLTGVGWNVAAKSTTGGFGAWSDDVSALTDAVIAPVGLLDVDTEAVAAAFRTRSVDAGAHVLAEALVRALDARPAGRIRLAREVAAVADCAERDRSIRRVEQLADSAGVTTRTLQRMFATCAGVSPTWVLRRFRLIEAAELVSGGQDADWSAVAAELGYADQAHLTRDFSATLGISPAAYARAQRPPEP